MQRTQNELLSTKNYYSSIRNKNSAGETTHTNLKIVVELFLSRLVLNTNPPLSRYLILQIKKSFSSFRVKLSWESLNFGLLDFYFEMMDIFLHF